MRNMRILCIVPSCFLAPLNELPLGGRNFRKYLFLHNKTSNREISILDGFSSGSVPESVGKGCESQIAYPYVRRKSPKAFAVPRRPNKLWAEDS